MTTDLRLRLRTPQGLIVDRDVVSIVAEDLSGFFGIWPHRADMVAALPAGLLSYHDQEGEVFVALSGGLLDLRGGECRVMAREARLTRDLSCAAEILSQAFEQRASRTEARREVLLKLEREALRRSAEGAR